MRWINALALDTWASTQIGRAEVARLVAKLVWATAPALNSFRFPSGDAGEIPGFDGHLVAPDEFIHPFVPSGESVWEFGTGQKYFKKAEDDYAIRTANPGAVVSSQCTFVFVTPRIWDRDEPTLVEWEKQKQAKHNWRDVRAIHGVKLEHWLERHEAVAKDFAREVKGLAYVDGARSVREFWEEYSGRFNEKLIEAVILAGRRSDADDLIKQLVSGVPQAIKLQADSRDEVVAFVAAAIRSAEAGVREFLEARALVLDTKQAVVQRAAAEGMVFLPRDEAVLLTSQDVRFYSHTICPLYSIKFRPGRKGGASIKEAPFLTGPERG